MAVTAVEKDAVEVVRGDVIRCITQWERIVDVEEYNGPLAYLDDSGCPLSQAEAASRGIRSARIARFADGTGMTLIPPARRTRSSSEWPKAPRLLRLSRSPSGTARVATGQRIGRSSKRGGVPVCPLDGRPGFHAEPTWWADVDRYEADGHPGYRARVEALEIP